MGFLVKSSMKKSLPYLYVGLTFGFCGSLTTFSSWVYAIVNGPDSLIQLLTGLTLPLCAFLLGEDLCSSLSLLSRCAPAPGNRCPSDKTVCQVLCVAVGLGVIIGLGVVLGNSRQETPDGVALVSCVLAPVGALPRYVLQRLLNDRIPWLEGRFQLGTLAANMAAVALYAFVHDCYNGGQKECHYVAVGICGSMSTVSSLMSEFVKDYRKGKAWAYLYVIVSVILAVFISGIEKIATGYRQKEGQD